MNIFYFISAVGYIVIYNVPVDENDNLTTLIHKQLIECLIAVLPFINIYYLIKTIFGMFKNTKQDINYNDYI